MTRGTGFWINLKSAEETGIAFTTVATAAIPVSDASALSSIDSSSLAWDSEVSSRYPEMTALASSLRSEAITGSDNGSATATATATAIATATSTGGANALAAFGDAGTGASTGSSTLVALLACVAYMAVAAFGPRL